MNREKIREWEDEVNRLAVETDHLNELLTLELRKFWEGEAYEACLRESKDNRELVQQAVQDHRKVIEACSSSGDVAESLPLDFLL